METKKGIFVSNMKDKIIYKSIESLQSEGLKFSVDTLAENLKISKKTIYKYFSTKEELALAVYERYYIDARNRAHILLDEKGSSLLFDLLCLYYDSKKMICREIFNKYKLNEVVYSYASSQNDSLWTMISAAFSNNVNENDKDTLRIIIDGTFEKICYFKSNPDAVIERLVKLL